MRWEDIVKLVAPLVLAYVKGGQKIAPIVPAVVNGIIEAEQIKGASGPDKKAHVIALVGDSVEAVNAAKPNSLDPATTKDTAGYVIDATVGVTNIVKQLHDATHPAPATDVSGVPVPAGSSGD